MTRSEALETLGLHESAAVAEIDRAYQDHYNDFRVRLDNAPTDRLRETFRGRLHQLEEAYGVLGRRTDDAAWEDLPASAPVDAAATAGAEKASAPPHRATLTVRCPESCAVCVGGGKRIDVPAGKSLRLRVAAGAHVVRAEADGRGWQKKVWVAEGEESAVTVELAAAPRGRRSVAAAGGEAAPASERLRWWEVLYIVAVVELIAGLGFSGLFASNFAYVMFDDEVLVLGFLAALPLAAVVVYLVSRLRRRLSRGR